MEHRCPTCHKIVTVSAQQRYENKSFFPFCSSRCKLIDLGAWLDVGYKIISDPESEQSAEPTADLSE